MKKPMQFAPASALLLAVFFAACQAENRSVANPFDNAPPVPLDPELQFEYVLKPIAGGVFMMGATNTKKGFDTDECPHEVAVGNFQIGAYEVTQLQWKSVMGSNPSGFAGCYECPVDNVSWIDAKEFIRRLNGKTGRNYRLPTEAEWEYAARGGASGEGKKWLYAGSDRLDKIAWYNENGKKKTHPVGEKAPNAFGLYDMCGNVREWCEDRYEAYPGCSTAPALGSTRTCRGGSWASSYYACRVSERIGVEPSGRYYNMGLRLAHD